MIHEEFTQKQLRLSRRGFWLVCALLVCLRLALTSFQQAYTWVGGSRWTMN